MTRYFLGVDVGGTFTDVVVFDGRSIRGHKVPTSYPSRRAYIHLAAADQDGALLFESGRLATDVDGLVRPEVTDLTVQRDASTSLDEIALIEVPDGTSVARFSTFAAEVNADDLVWLFDGQITEAGPETASPAANTYGIEVCIVCG